MKLVALRVLLLFLAAFGAAGAQQLPARIDPGEPFPRILEEAPTLEDIAPGVEYGDYALITSIGPLAIHVVAVDPHRSDVHVESVLANNSLESRGETVGSIARRTAAVAGINGDYFDIGNTNRPENLVVRDGTLLNLPSRRYALAIARDGSPHIAQFTFSGEMQFEQRAMPLDGIDELPPPEGGLSLITPAYGRVPPQENVTLVALEPWEGTPPLARYRVVGVADNLAAQPPGYYAAIGPNDYGVLDIPQAGSLVAASGDLAPLDLGSIASAIGGGPLILHDGEWFDDPQGPSGGEFAKRIPSSGAAITPDGRLLLIEVDGRQPEVSVGLKRPEFAELMRALGATEGMALDGGGSSTIAVRRLGESDAEMVNSPSDGIERRVGDGLFVYSTAPAGPAVRLIARPSIVRALTGAEVPLRVAALDAAYHVAATRTQIQVSVSPASLGTFHDGAFVALHSGAGRLELRESNLRGEVPIEVDATPARAKIVPARPNVDPNATIPLSARAFDAHGYALALPASLQWSATGGSIDGRGQYQAGSHNGNASVRIGSVVASVRITVGSHDVALPFAQHAHFVTLRAGGRGSLDSNAGCASCVRLTFAFGEGERAAYAMADIALPADTLGLRFDLLDDGSAGRVRVALRNEINEETLLDATELGQPGWRDVVVRFPPDTEGSRLIAIYVLPPKGIELSEGSIVLRNVRAIVAGQ
jgi:hypothetical protein